MVLCDNCKLREAKIYYTEIIDGVKKEQHLCEECAKKYTNFKLDESLSQKQLTLGNLLSTLFDVYIKDEADEEAEKTLVCSRCGQTYQEFLEQGIFGCAHCYKAFKNPLEASIKKIQGATKHTGRMPVGFETEMEQIIHSMSEVDRLSIQLQQAVEKEEFEEAARLRDLIRALKKKEVEEKDSLENDQKEELKNE